MYKKIFISDEEAKELILDIGNRMFVRNFVAANDGNITCKVSPNEIWATPTGVSKGFMRKQDLIKMKLDGTIIQENGIKPSSEIKMHLRIFQENPEVMAVTHAHPPVSTAFAIAGIALDDIISPEAFVNLGVVPCVHYETPGSEGIPESVAPYAKDYSALLLANHGAVTWGRSLLEAYYRLESLEGYATSILYSKYIIGKANVLGCDQVQELIDIRKNQGVETVFDPKCVEKPENMKDIV